MRVFTARLRHARLIIAATSPSPHLPSFSSPADHSVLRHADAILTARYHCFAALRCLLLARPPRVTRCFIRRPNMPPRTFTLIPPFIAAAAKPRFSLKPHRRLLCSSPPYFSRAPPAAAFVRPAADIPPHAFAANNIEDAATTTPTRTSLQRTASPRIYRRHATPTEPPMFREQAKVAYGKSLIADYDARAEPAHMLAPLQRQQR